MATVTGTSITVLTGPLAGQRFGVSSPELVIGRQGANVVIPDDEVSRRHASLRPVPGGIEVVDLGSLNGTWVEGARIGAPVVVGEGARLRVGATTFVLNVAADGRRGDTAVTPSPAPFAPALPPRSRRPRGVATRLWVPAALSFAAILGTAVALLLYFSLR